MNKHHKGNKRCLKKALNLKKSIKPPKYGKTSHFHGLTGVILCNGHSSKSDYRYNAVYSSQK